MDDSERSYGYSEDIYHGSHGRNAEKSYEYGPEDPNDTEGHELSPEEEAIRIEGSHAGEEPVADPEAGTYDYGRGGESGGTESFTWDIPGTDLEREAKASETKQRPDLAEQRLEPAKREP
jgi:hypothetical protein